MTYFKDLSPYSYYGNEESLNIGWLSAIEGFDIGDTTIEFREKLFRFCLDENIVKTMRGFHECELCGFSFDEWSRDHPAYGDNANWMSIGNGEIRIIGKGVIYAVPALIYHYVVEHHYMPPQEFIDAVLTGPQPGSLEYNTLLQKYKRR
ncbi:MAG: hypothetical protein IPM31_05160 [Anaerolineae bacterium]|nr:hypothetical protein [Anaerolineae bacterium]MBL8106293.1 hypothetical protein [Anaerolineales bacterium]MCC7188236.1 hypothetical protein [Anaerolineales bacterium]